jgi:hypothetical protein
MSKLPHSLSTKRQKSHHNFGDKRINKRATFMIEKMSKNFQQPLPQIFCTEKDLTGAYRFFGNNLVTPEILESHKNETISRCKQVETVLALHDSSDVCFDYMECLEGFESMHSNSEKDFRIHPVLATTEEGTPLGVLATFNYTREEKQTTKNRNSLPIEDKESFRWLQGYRQACMLAQQIPDVQIISIADRESDIWECFMEATDNEIPVKADILIRSQHNRVLDEKNDFVNKLEKKLIRCTRHIMLILI